MLRREDHFQWPSLGESVGQCAVSDAKPSRPFSETQCLAVERQHSSFAGILSLLQLCSPAAVAGFIVAVVIFAIDRCFWKWFHTHVSKEVIKASSPPLAKRDTSVGVQVPIFVARITSTLYLFPRCVFRCFAVTPRTSASTATGDCPAVSFTKITSRYHSGRTALTAAPPSRVSAFSFTDILKYGQFSVNVSRLIFNAGRDLIRLLFSHLSLLIRFTVDRTARNVEFRAVHLFYAGGV